MLLDGYDLVIYGSMLSRLINKWNLASQAAGLFGAASLICIMIGTLTLGIAADNFGRKNIIDDSDYGCHFGGPAKKLDLLIDTYRACWTFKAPTKDRHKWERPYSHNFA